LVEVEVTSSQTNSLPDPESRPGHHEHHGLEARLDGRREPFQLFNCEEARLEALSPRKMGPVRWIGAQRSRVDGEVEDLPQHGKRPLDARRSEPRCEAIHPFLDDLVCDLREQCVSEHG
jgi:hypothetical protein